jgi:hypothetical protein
MPTATRATATTGTPVLVDGVRTRLVGRVSMDMLTVDLTPGACPDAGFGSEVTLWGRASSGAVLPIDEVAQAAGTVGYELMCALAPRVPVVVVLALGHVHAVVEGDARCHMVGTHHQRDQQQGGKGGGAECAGRAHGWAIAVNTARACVHAAGSSPAARP